MELTLNIILIIIFLGMLVISTKILLDTNFVKLFKMGRINSIRVAYVICIFVISALTAFCFRELIKVIYDILLFNK